MMIVCCITLARYIHTHPSTPLKALTLSLLKVIHIIKYAPTYDILSYTRDVKGYSSKCKPSTFQGIGIQHLHID